MLSCLYISLEVYLVNKKGFMEDKLNIFLKELKKTKKLVNNLNSATKSNSSSITTIEIMKDLEILKEKVCKNTEMFENIVNASHNN